MLGFLSKGTRDLRVSTSKIVKITAVRKNHHKSNHVNLLHHLRKCR
jgi:hypothetical protein